MPDIDGILCDVHGVLYIHPRALPGSPEAVATLRKSGLPFRFLTNSTQFPKAHILNSLKELGIDLKPEELITSPEAGGAVLRALGAERVGWLCRPALAGDLPGVRPVFPGDGDSGAVDAVLVGDLGEGFTYETLNQAFRWLQQGAELVALARNRFYQSQDGLVLDSGPFVRLLEEASGRTAVVTGKPSPQFFKAGLDSIGVAAECSAMIGDDLEYDVLAAMDLGLTGILVRTGKFRQESLEASKHQPHHVLDDLAQAVDFLLGS